VIADRKITSTEEKNSNETLLALFEDKVLLTVPEVAKILRIGRTKAYELVRDDIIPSIRLGKHIRVPLVSLKKWLQIQVNSDIQ